MAPKHLKPQLKVKKPKKQLTLTSLPGEISYSSVLGKHDRRDKRVKSYDIVHCPSSLQCVHNLF